MNPEQSKRKFKILFILFWVLLFAFVVKTRIKYHSPYLFTWDSVQYALSLDDFNVRLHQPHPPGYLLYSFTLRFWNSFISDPNFSMISLNVIALLATCVLISLLVLEFCRDMPEEKKYALAAGSAAIYATTPIAWLYSCVAEIYAVEAFFTALVLYLGVVSWRRPRFLLWASIAMAIAGGFRPTTEFFLLPLYAASFLGKDRRTILQSACLWVAINSLWFGILVYLTDGLSNYLNLLGKHTEISLTEAEITDQSKGTMWAFSTITLRLIQACSVPLLIALLVRCWKVRPSLKELSPLLIAVPALLFSLFVFYSKEGYLLIAYVPLLAFLVVQFGRLYKSILLYAIVFSLACTLNYRAYVKPPLYSDAVTQQSTVKWILNQLTLPNKHVVNARTVRIRDFFAKVDQLNPGQKLFVFHGEYYPDWRTVMYYRPQDIALLVAPKSKRANAASGRKYTLVLPPYELSPAIRTIVSISKEDPEMKMNSFEVYEYRYFYALKRELPPRFRIYRFEFQK